jgi:hypothetical protein
MLSSISVGIDGMDRRIATREIKELDAPLFFVSISSIQP